MQTASGPQDSHPSIANRHVRGTVYQAVCDTPGRLYQTLLVLKGAHDNQSTLASSDTSVVAHRLKLALLFGLPRVARHVQIAPEEYKYGRQRREVVKEREIKLTTQSNDNEVQSAPISVE